MISCLFCTNNFIKILLDFLTIIGIIIFTVNCSFYVIFNFITINNVREMKIGA